MIYYTISIYIYIVYLILHIFVPALANSGGGGAGPLGGADMLIFASSWKSKGASFTNKTWRTYGFIGMSWYE